MGSRSDRGWPMSRKEAPEKNWLCATEPHIVGPEVNVELCVPTERSDPRARPLHHDPKHCISYQRVCYPGFRKMRKGGGEEMGSKLLFRADTQDDRSHLTAESRRAEDMLMSQNSELALRR